MECAGIPEVGRADIVHHPADRPGLTPGRPGLIEDVEIVITLQRRLCGAMLFKADVELTAQRGDPSLLAPAELNQLTDRPFLIQAARPFQSLTQPVPEGMISGPQPLQQRIARRGRDHQRQRLFLVLGRAIDFSNHVLLFGGLA